MHRTLDDLAEAIAIAGDRRCPRRVARSDELFRQFGLPITPSRWAELERHLRCELPPLERCRDGLWSFPRRWETVWDLARYLSEVCPEWQPPLAADAADWLEAQIFVVIRDTLVEALNVDKEEVVRSTRIITDLGAE